MVHEDTLAQQAYSALRDKLASGDLAPGARLVNRTLASELGLSMTPVREAINRLASDGAVQLVPGAGAYVRRIEPRDLEQIYELRLLLEPYAAAQAARSASPRQLDDIAAECDEGERLAEQLTARKKTADARHVAQWSALEARFHLAVLAAANNPWLVSAVEGLRLLHRISIAHQSLRGALLQGETATRTARDHRKLAEAIASRDEALAEQLMREHILRGQKQVLGLLRTKNERGS